MTHCVPQASTPSLPRLLNAVDSFLRCLKESLGASYSFLACSSLYSVLLCLGLQSSEALARAMKEWERRPGERTGFSDSPGDCLAFKYLRDVSDLLTYAFVTVIFKYACLVHLLCFTALAALFTAWHSERFFITPLRSAWMVAGCRMFSTQVC